MFDQTFVNTRAEARRPWTVAASLGLQASLLAAALIVPLFHIESIHALTTEPVYMRLEPRPPVKIVRAVEQSMALGPRRAWNPLAGPTKVPSTILMPSDAPDLAYAAAPAESASIVVLPAVIPPPAQSVVKTEPAPPRSPGANQRGRTGRKTHLRTKAGLPATGARRARTRNGQDTGRHLARRDHQKPARSQRPAITRRRRDRSRAAMALPTHTAQLGASRSSD